MEDNEIIRLYLDRNEEAVRRTSEKYGVYLMSVARNIVGLQADAEECVNDAYLKAWQSIPPRQPANLRAYLGRIARNLAINRYERERAEKRGGYAVDAVLDELDELVSDGGDFTRDDSAAITIAINRFLEKQKPLNRRIFVLRYWYSMSIEEIANKEGVTAGSVKTALCRMRKTLKKELEKGGVLM